MTGPLPYVNNTKIYRKSVNKRTKNFHNHKILNVIFNVGNFKRQDSELLKTRQIVIKLRNPLSLVVILSNLRTWPNQLETLTLHPSSKCPSQRDYLLFLSLYFQSSPPVIYVETIYSIYLAQNTYYCTKITHDKM